MKLFLLPFCASSEIPVNQTNGTASGSGLAANAVQGPPDAENRATTSQGSSVLYNFREMQRRQVEFIKKRVLLLEKAVNTEYGTEVLGDQQTNETPGCELETVAKVVDIPSACSKDIDAQTMSNLPQIGEIKMAEAQAKGGPVIPELVLKKQRRSEEWALKKKEELTALKKKNAENRKLIFNRAKLYTKEYEQQQK